MIHYILRTQERRPLVLPTWEQLIQNQNIANKWHSQCAQYMKQKINTHSANITLHMQNQITIWKRKKVHQKILLKTKQNSKGKRHPPQTPPGHYDSVPWWQNSSHLTFLDVVKACCSGKVLLISVKPFKNLGIYYDKYMVLAKGGRTTRFCF